MHGIPSSPVAMTVDEAQALADIPTPDAGFLIKFTDSADGLPKMKFSNGDVVLDVVTDTDGAIVGPIVVRNLTETATNAKTLLEGEIAKTSDTGSVRLGDGVQEGGVAGNMASSAMILCPAIGTPVENAARLRALYTEAKTYTPGGSALSATNRVVIHLGTGTYDFELGDVADLNHGLELDTEFIDLAGITGNPADVILTSAIATASRGTVEQTADDVRLSGFTMENTAASVGSGDTENSAYFPSTGLANTELTDIICPSASSSAAMRKAIEYAGTYTRVTAGLYSFGNSGTASGTFINCIGSDFSFGYDGTASGTFIDCTSTGRGFGGIASGTFINCNGDDSFGYNGTASGIFINCTSTGRSFGYNGTASGTFRNCIGEHNSFNTVTAAAILFDCLLETGSGTGIFAYMPENVKRKNYSDDPTGTVDLTSPVDIEWINETGYDGLFSDKITMSGVDTAATTYSVSVSAYATSVGVAGAAGLITVDSDSFNPDQWVAGTLVDCAWNDGSPKSRTDVEILSKTTGTITLDGATGTGDALPTSGAITLTGDPAASYDSSSFSRTKGVTVAGATFDIPIPDYLGDLKNGETWVVTWESDNANDTVIGYLRKVIQKAVL